MAERADRFLPGGGLRVVTLVVLCAVLAYPTWKFYSLWRVHKDNERTAVLVRCAFNQRTIGLALAAYLRDNADVYPDTLDRLVLYLSDNSVLRCPVKGDGPRAAPTGAGVTSDYVYLVGGMPGPLSPNAVVLVDARQNHGDKRVNVLYADGEVALIHDASDRRKLFEQVDSGKRTVILPRE